MDKSGELRIQAVVLRDMARRARLIARSQTGPDKATFLRVACELEAEADELERLAAAEEDRTLH